MTHVGRLIEDELHRQGLSVTWFAEQLCCARTNVYKIFRKSSIDTELLLRISDILQYDFFSMLLSVFKEQKGNDVVVDTSFPSLL